LLKQSGKKYTGKHKRTEQFNTLLWVNIVILSVIVAFQTKLIMNLVNYEDYIQVIQSKDSIIQAYGEEIDKQYLEIDRLNQRIFELNNQLERETNGE
jgi:peptidoglycan hydrolase CwlO-like protein